MEAVNPISTMMMIMMSAIVFGFASAENRTVGGSSGWSLSSDISQWSSSTSFFVNDSLVFLYTPDHDVIEVSRADFISCQISSPIATYDEGVTVILLSQPGTRYFVCGRPRHCGMGMKLRVPVLYQSNPPSGSPQPTSPSSNSNTTQKPGPPQPSAGGSHGNGTNDHHGSSPSNGSSSASFVNFASSLLYLGISILALSNHDA